jgi:hypothetical protein
MMMSYISKRAAAMDDLKEVVFSLWKNDKGPFENILGLSSYLIPFLPGLGWAVFLIEKAASLFGYGLGDFGKWIDGELGLGPYSNITLQHQEELKQALMKKTSSMEEEGLVKNAAAWSALFKMIGGVPKLVKGMFIILKALLLALGVEKVIDIYKQKKLQMDVSGPVEMAKEVAKKELAPSLISKDPMTGLVTNVLTQNIMGQDVPSTVKDLKQDTSTMPVNPMALINMFK